MKIKSEYIYTFICAFVGVTVTWYMNHEMGFGSIVANGLVGITAAVFLPEKLAGITYTSSFVGMSSQEIIPSLPVAAFASIVVAILLNLTAEIYAGIGGKGRTTAALSTIITKTITNLLT